MGSLPSTAVEPTADPLYSHGADHEYGGSDPIPGVYHGGGGGAVTQLTSITTGVTINQRRGVITTVSQTIAAGAEATFTVTNSTVHLEDFIVVHLRSTSSAGGPFLAYCSAVADGSFDITITNPHAATAGNNTLLINFAVLSVVL